MMNLKAWFRRAGKYSAPDSDRPEANSAPAPEKPLRGGLRRWPPPGPFKKWEPPTKGTTPADRPRRRRRRARAARAALRNAR